jgi:RNA polymerase sigma-70 factor (ECF subfamily)
VLRRRKHLALLKVEATAEPPRVDPVADMQREERAEAVRRALDALTERDREVLLLRDAGLSYPEIAERTGLAVGAVGTTLCRARKRLVDAHASLEARGAEGHPAVPGNREGTHAARG